LHRVSFLIIYLPETRDTGRSRTPRVPESSGCYCYR